MGDKGTLWLPEGVSTLAPEVDRLFYFVTWVSVVLFVGVVAAIIYFVIRYRRRDPMERPAPVEPNKIVEASWVIVPTILVLVVFNWGFKAYINLQVAPPDAYVVNVEAQMWKWDFVYANGKRSTAELHVPMGRPIRLRMTSQDVIHSFFAPNFRVKQDVLPDRYTYVWFQPTRSGEFQVFCTEYCGNQHSSMLAKIIVEPQDTFNAWLATGAGEGMDPVQLGEQLFNQQACVGCHTTDGTRKVGPTFQNLMGRTETLQDGSTVVVDENYIRESILQPQAKVVQGYQPIMPTFSTLTETQVNGLIAFIKAQSQ